MIAKISFLLLAFSVPAAFGAAGTNCATNKQATSSFDSFCDKSCEFYDGIFPQTAEGRHKAMTAISNTMRWCACIKKNVPYWNYAEPGCSYFAETIPAIMKDPKALQCDQKIKELQ